MKSIKKVKLYGDINNTEDRLGVISFNLENLCCYDVAQMIANESGISLRCGKFCAHPYVNRLLGVNDAKAYYDVFFGEGNLGMIRASLGLYNTIDEANIFLNKLEDIAKKYK